MSQTKITNMEQLTEVDNKQYVELFVNNINVIFQYGESDIIKTLEAKSLDIIMEIRNKLCDKLKECLPEFSMRQPINRKVKHLAISDVIQLAKLCSETLQFVMLRVYLSHRSP